MARRSYKTELGCIACEELGELGAGKPNWLVETPHLLCAIDTHSLLLANRSTILLLSWSAHSDPPLKIRPDLSPIEAESITALEWLAFQDHRVIVAGTSSGYLLLYSLRGDLIHRQLRVRGTKKDLIQDTSSEEFCLILPGVIARFDGSDVQNRLQKWFEEANSRFWDQKPKSQDSEDFGNTDVTIPYQLWNIGKHGTCSDAAITGIMPPPLMEHQSSQRYYCAVAVGEDAVISAYSIILTLLLFDPLGRLSESKGRSLVGAILSRVVPATFSTLSSFSKLIWRSEPSSPKKSPKKVDQKPQPFARASPLTCLMDHPRKGEKLTLSPSGTLAAITDSLGRILLLDTQALVVVRLWKGYRDASCLFMEMLVNNDVASSSSSYSEPLKSDYCLCLAIHAPRKGIIEIWQMRTGPRLRTISCAKGSKMLQPSYRFGASMSSPYVPLEVFLLNGDSGQISIVNRTLDS
ncbi:unnamed protein product [Sphenostylis stenocarpa]|uniref:Rab3-GAP regulatory subunit N-terminal domain-containing protein n=1 Tax=Sphenostylis stenocarpa TaxID=92480 RepID=A0AA86W5S6_9FABA|nr:unnamed protein product [Sphenostylis stenocarpa]